MTHFKWIFVFFIVVICFGCQRQDKDVIRVSNIANEKAAEVAKPHYVVIDVAAQAAYLYDGPFPFYFDRYGKGGRLLANKFILANIIESYHCSTGKEGNSTPIGVATIERNFRDRPGFVEGTGAPLYFQLHLVGMGGVSIHAWNDVPDHPASHGCIRLQLADAKRLYYGLADDKLARAFIVRSIYDQPRARKHRRYHKPTRKGRFFLSHYLYKLSVVIFRLKNEKYLANTFINS